MARRCSLTGKGVLSGNRVSHANNKSRRRFLPNIKHRHLFSEVLGEPLRLKIALSTLRTIEKVGGIDAFLLDQVDASLGRDLVRLKDRIAVKRAAA